MHTTESSCKSFAGGWVRAHDAEYIIVLADAVQKEGSCNPTLTEVRTNHQLSYPQDVAILILPPTGKCMTNENPVNYCSSVYAVGTLGKTLLPQTRGVHSDTLACAEVN